MRKHIRVLPSADSFADEIDSEEEIFRHDIEHGGFQAFDCGSYVMLPDKVGIC